MTKQPTIMEFLNFFLYFLQILLYLIWCSFGELFLLQAGHPEKAMATHSSTLAWKIPGTEEPSGLASMGSNRVRHNWSDLAAAAALHLIEQVWGCTKIIPTKPKAWQAVNSQNMSAIIIIVIITRWSPCRTLPTKNRRNPPGQCKGRYRGETGMKHSSPKHPRNTSLLQPFQLRAPFKLPSPETTRSPHSPSWQEWLPAGSHVSSINKVWQRTHHPGASVCAGCLEQMAGWEWAFATTPPLPPRHQAGEGTQMPLRGNFLLTMKWPLAWIMFSEPQRTLGSLFHFCWGTWVTSHLPITSGRGRGCGAGLGDSGGLCKDRDWSFSTSACLAHSGVLR